MPQGRIGRATAVLEARVDVRDLANFAKFLVDSGEQVVSRSDLVWKAFRSITESLKATSQPLFTTTEEAMEYMASLGIGSMNRPGRGSRALNSFTLAKTVEAERGNELTVDELVKMIKEKSK